LGHGKPVENFHDLLGQFSAEGFGTLPGDVRLIKVTTVSLLHSLCARLLLEPGTQSTPEGRTR
jgi:hypothetical protein